VHGNWFCLGTEDYFRTQITCRQRKRGSRTRPHGKRIKKEYSPFSHFENVRAFAYWMNLLAPNIEIPIPNKETISPIQPVEVKQPSASTPNPIMDGPTTNQQAKPHSNAITPKTI
jgi:hypothetical protein